MRLGLFTAIAIAATTSVVAAPMDELFKDYGTCYAAQYDDAHLASHPKQRVWAIYLSNTATPDPSYDGVMLEFGFVLRDGELYTANAYCSEGDQCSLEGDGGTFDIDTHRDGLRIDVRGFLGIEGKNGWSGDLSKSDDRVFIIARQSPRACSYE